MLKNGLIQEDRRAVKILCEYQHGLRLLAWARQKAPDDAHLVTIKPDNQNVARVYGMRLRSIMMLAALAEARF